MFANIVFAFSTSYMQIDYYKCAEKTICIGDKYLVDKESSVLSEIKKYNINLYNAYYTNLVDDSFNSKMVAFSTEDYAIKENYVIMDKLSYYRNNFPEHITIYYHNSEITLSVLNDIFSEEKGVFLGSNYNNFESDYMYFSIDESNFDDICHIYDDKMGTGLINIENSNLYNLKNEIFNLNERNRSNYLIIVLLSCLLINMIFIFLCFSLVNKFYPDIKLFYIRGYGLFDITKFFLVPLFLCVIIGTIISIPTNFILVSIYNSLIKVTTPSIKFSTIGITFLFIQIVLALIAFLMQVIYVKVRLLKEWE